MPRTRNVTRSQWDETNTTSTNSSRSRRQNENSMAESGKENVDLQGSRATRSQARAGGRTGLSAASNIAVLGTTAMTASKSTSQKTATKLKTASKGQGVPPPPILKRKKQPLQDITAEFLPAQAEAANRGEEALTEDGVNDGAGSQASRNANVITTIAPPEIAPVFVLPARQFTSPLPPSSPPSAHYVSPSLHPTSSAPKFLDNIAFSSTHSILYESYGPWQELDDTHLESDTSVGHVSSNSDPFGFVSLERKLKADREAVAILAPEQEHEEAALVLVADTSSPRPVRRLKRPLEDEAELPEAVEEVHDRPHYATPPTPHKDKQKRRKMSHEGHDVFSPCSSSVEPSPSPTKASARKLPPHVLSDDPLDKFNEEFDRSFEAAKGSKHDLVAKEVTVDLGAVSRNLRSREKPQQRLQLDMAEEDRSNKVIVKGKGKSVKKPVNKSRSATTRKNATTKQVADAGDEHEEEDLDETWERARQERIEYFKRLESYEVEKEDVFLI